MGNRADVGGRGTDAAVAKLFRDFLSNRPIELSRDPRAAEHRRLALAASLVLTHGVRMPGAMLRRRESVLLKQADLPAQVVLVVARLFERAVRR